MTIVLACLIGILGGVGAFLFNELIELVDQWTIDIVLSHETWLVLLCVVPALGLLVVGWMTRTFAPEAQGHGVPEVILAVARNDGKIRPRVSFIKILASGICIGTGGSVGREGPIVQIGSALGSAAGQIFKLPPRYLKVLVAAGAAAGISATFNAPLAGVIFASEIILGSFAVESLTPIVIAAVLADNVQTQIGEHGLRPPFENIDYAYLGAWGELPSYLLLGLLCGIVAVGFIKVLYATEDLTQKWIPRWWLRALTCGLAVGVAGWLYPQISPVDSLRQQHTVPPILGVGYEVVTSCVSMDKTEFITQPPDNGSSPEKQGAGVLDRSLLLRQLWWLLPLVLLKPLATSITVGGGGSGGIFAPSLFLGATLGGCFGIVCNLLVPGISAPPGVYAIVGMAAVVAGTTHGVLSATIIVYEMTDDYKIILPIMAAAGLASVVARFIDPESIYHKKLSRRGISLARGHDATRLEHITVRNVMIRRFPSVRQSDNVTEIVKVARANPQFECLPVMKSDGQLAGIIRPEDLHRVLDTEISPDLIYAEDIAFQTSIAVAPDENLLEAMRAFGSSDVETLPVEVGQGESKRLVGLLLRSDVMRRYREAMLAPN